ncbi:odorant receptor 129-1 [Brienomyrus brachyistius]|uniref:odorant receptor 129-1 n=1 Tax=Brienomyrus brachyistius TaxID=42636 RepID=UPI0020B3AACF|nr:odorant receptor 129-1 [Brienomyrus brachyistius]
MQNETGILGNTTMNKGLSATLKIFFVIPFFMIFFYCIVVMLYTFASNRQFWDSSRYILFVYMLINDTLQLSLSMILFFFVMADLRIFFASCISLLFLSTATFQNTPLILATMSLERYVAILYPLQQPTMWQADRIWVIMLALWLTSCILPIVDFSLGQLQPDSGTFSRMVLCRSGILNLFPIQTLFKVVLNRVFFGLVAIIILFTYIRILFETRRMRQDRASVTKALQTVLLHGLQLLLCMISFAQPVTENLLMMHVSWLRENIIFFNFFCVILLPRFLSPLIYGLRDDILRRHIKGAVFCCSASVHPMATRKHFLK